jgi:hypothetical protein
LRLLKRRADELFDRRDAELAANVVADAERFLAAAASN